MKKFPFITITLIGFIVTKRGKNLFDYLLIRLPKIKWLTLLWFANKTFYIMETNKNFSMPFLTSHYYNKYDWEFFYYLYSMSTIYPKNNSIQRIIDTHCFSYFG